MTSIGIDLGSTGTRVGVSGDGASGEGTPAAVVHAPIPDLLLRVGDPSTLVIDGVAKTATVLLGELLDAALSSVADPLDRALRPVTVVVPTAWGPLRQQQVRDALTAINVPTAEIVPSAEAIVTLLSSGNAGVPGAADGLVEGVVAVVDAGGHSTSAALVRLADGEATLLGEPDGVESLGGAELDRALLDLLTRLVDGEEIAACWPQDVQPSSVDDTMTGVRLVRERLSEADTVPVDVALGDGGSTVSVTRTDFEAAARPVFERIAGVAAEVIAASELPDGAATCVLLVGGVARTPALAEIMRERTAWTVVAPTHPELLAVRAATAWAAAAAIGTSGSPVLERGIDLLGGTGALDDTEGDASLGIDWKRARPKIAAGVAVTTAALIAYAMNADAGVRQDAQRAPDLNRDAVRANAPDSTATESENGSDHRRLKSEAATPHLSGHTDATGGSTPPPSKTGASGAAGAAGASGAKGATPAPTARTESATGAGPVVAGLSNDTNEPVVDSPAPGLSDSLQQMADGLFSKASAQPTHPPQSTRPTGSAQSAQSAHKPRHGQGTPDAGSDDTGSSGQGSSNPIDIGSTVQTVAHALNPTTRPKHSHASHSKPKSAQTADTPKPKSKSTHQQASEGSTEIVHQPAGDPSYSVVHHHPDGSTQTEVADVKPTAAQLEQQRKAKEFYANMKNLTPEQQAQAGQFFKNLSTMTPEQQAQAGEFFKALAAQQK